MSILYEDDITIPAIPTPQAQVTTGLADPNQTIKTTTKEVINDFQPKANEYKINPFTAEQEKQALKDAENSTAFSLLMDEKKEKEKQYQERLAKSGQAAKALAWMNLFTNLAKLGGAGYAPVIKEDNTHLFKAFNDVDNVRNMLEESNDKYSSALTKFKLQSVQNARDAHNAREKALYDANQKYVDAYNKLGGKKSKEVTTVTEYDPNKAVNDKLKQDKLQAQIDDINARKDLTKEKKKQLIEKLKNNQSSGKKAFYEFENKNDGYTYYISKSKAVDIENYLAAISEGKIPDIDGALKNEINKDLSVLSRVYDADMKDAETLRVISKYLQKYPGLFGDFFSGAERVKTRYNNADLGFEEEIANDQFNNNVSSLIK